MRDRKFEKNIRYLDNANHCLKIIFPKLASLKINTYFRVSQFLSLDISYFLNIFTYMI